MSSVNDSACDSHYETELVILFHLGFAARVRRRQNGTNEDSDDDE
jgi:hypothetical protein